MDKSVKGFTSLPTLAVCPLYLSYPRKQAGIFLGFGYSPTANNVANISMNSLAIPPHFIAQNISVEIFYTYWAKQDCFICSPDLMHCLSLSIDGSQASLVLLLFFSTLLQIAYLIYTAAFKIFSTPLVCTSFFTICLDTVSVCVYFAF